MGERNKNIAGAVATLSLVGLTATVTVMVLTATEDAPCARDGAVG